MWQNFSGRVYLLCTPCFNCLCSVSTMSLVHKKILLVNFWNPKWPIDLKWPEMRSKVNFGHLKWPKTAILSKISKKKYRSEMARNASDLNNVRTDCWLTTTWYQYIYTYRQLCWERGNIHCVRPLGRMHTILVFNASPCATTTNFTWRVRVMYKILFIIFRLCHYLKPRIISCSSADGIHSKVNGLYLYRLLNEYIVLGPSSWVTEIARWSIRPNNEVPKHCMSSITELLYRSIPL